MGYDCHHLQNYTSYSWHPGATIKNSRVANARWRTVPFRIASKNLRTFISAELHRQSMQDNKLGDDKKKWDHGMLGANWRSSDMEDANKQIEPRESTRPWLGGEQWSDTWDKPQALKGNASEWNLLLFFYQLRANNRKPMKILLSRWGVWNAGSNPSLLTEQAFRPCRQRNTQTRGKQTRNETRLHQVTLNDKQTTLLSLMTLA